MAHIITQRNNRKVVQIFCGLAMMAVLTSACHDAGDSPNPDPAHIYWPVQCTNPILSEKLKAYCDEADLFYKNIVKLEVRTNQDTTIYRITELSGLCNLIDPFSTVSFITQINGIYTCVAYPEQDMIMSLDEIALSLKDAYPDFYETYLYHLETQKIPSYESAIMFPNVLIEASHVWVLKFLNGELISEEKTVS